MACRPKFFISLVIILLGVACAPSYSFRNFLLEEESQQLEEKFMEQDYVDQLLHLQKVFLNQFRDTIVPVPKILRRYLSGIFEKIVKNNETIFAQDVKPSFYIIKSITPFFFSLPNGNFFLSTGLINKYIKHENFLFACLAQETVKSLRNVYQKKPIVPLGFISLEKLLSMVKIPMEIKLELNKWTYFSLKRAGFDPHILLSWMQLLNRNALDFWQILGDPQNITREESLFKNFIVKESLSGEKIKLLEKNSSEDFYKFKKYFQNK